MMQQAAAFQTANKPPPMASRVTPRMIVFLLVVLALVGYPIYVFVEAAVTGGIRDRGDYKEVDLKAMSLFHFDQNNGTIDDVPAKWRALDGQKVVVVGEMWEPYSAGNLVAGFELVYSIAKCCFSGPPQIQHFVQSRVVPGKTVGYHSGPVEVTGTMRVKVTRDELGKITGVYHMDVESVRPVS
jgi:hypothetical protein